MPLLIELTGVVNAYLILCRGVRDIKAVAQLNTTNLILEARFEVLYVAGTE